jgi:cytochrome c oxidase subunit 2
VTADEAYLRDCILLPDKYRVAGFPPLMPNFSGTVSPGQVVSLVAYIKSLSVRSTETGQGASP